MIELMLDTNILIYIIKQKPISVIEKFKHHKPSNIAISAIVYAELMYGAYNSEHILKNIRSIHALIDNFQVLEFDTKAAEIYGKTKAHLRGLGTLISDNDLLIGSHALSLKLPLITNNSKEYARIPNLKIDNWV